MTSRPDAQVDRPRVTAIVVSYNTRDKLRRCLSCLGTDCEVIVVDNASSDGSADMVALEFPNAVLVRNAENRGFGAANNQGLDGASGELVLLLNSDAYMNDGAMALLVSTFESPEVVAAGPKLVNPDGTLQLSAANTLSLWAVLCEQTLLEKALPNSRWFSPYWLRPSGDQSVEVDQVMGACLMMRPLERFDERYFLYCEDTDLCLRLRRQGKILYVPAAQVVHDLGSSSESSRWRAVARYNQGKELYMRLHGGVGAWMACLALDRLGAFLRLCGWSVLCVGSGFRRDRKDQVRLFARVLSAPITRPIR